jgi:hypothetical protein
MDDGWRTSSSTSSPLFIVAATILMIGTTSKTRPNYVMLPIYEYIPHYIFSAHTNTLPQTQQLAALATGHVTTIQNRLLPLLIHGTNNTQIRSPSTHYLTNISTTIRSWGCIDFGVGWEKWWSWWMDGRWWWMDGWMIMDIGWINNNGHTQWPHNGCQGYTQPLPHVIQIVATHILHVHKVIHYIHTDYTYTHMYTHTHII